MLDRPREPEDCWERQQYRQYFSLFVHVVHSLTYDIRVLYYITGMGRPHKSSYTKLYE